MHLNYIHFYMNVIIVDFVEKRDRSKTIFRLIYMDNIKLTKLSLNNYVFFIN